jgi:predicted metal-dependent phosphoesterase TrpH
MLGKDVSRIKKIKRTMKDYEDILYLPHPVSNNRAKMKMADRAAQFSPFAAVVGHEAAIKETARYTDQKKELDEMEKVIIDEKLREIEAHLPEPLEVEIVYFKSDESKIGGHYLTKMGSVKKLDAYSKEILFLDGTSIAIEEIYSIDF